MSDVAIRHLIGEDEEASAGSEWLAALLGPPVRLAADDVEAHCGGEVTQRALPAESALSQRLCAELVAAAYLRFGLLLPEEAEGRRVHPLALAGVGSLSAGGEFNRLLVGAAWLGPPRRIERTPPTRRAHAAVPLDGAGLARALVEANLSRAARAAYRAVPQLDVSHALQAVQGELATADLLFLHAGDHAACRALQMVGGSAYCHVALVVRIGVDRPLLLEAEPAAFAPDRAQPAAKPLRLVDLEQRALGWLRAHPSNRVAVRRLSGRGVRRRMQREGAPILLRLHDRLDALPPSPVANGGLSFLCALFSERFVAGVQLEAMAAGTCPLHAAEVVAHGLAALGLLTDAPIPRASCRIRDLTGDGPTPSLPLAPHARWRKPVELHDGRFSSR